MQVQSDRHQGAGTGHFGASARWDKRTALAGETGRTGGYQLSKRPLDNAEPHPLRHLADRSRVESGHRRCITLQSPSLTVGVV